MRRKDRPDKNKNKLVLNKQTVRELKPVELERGAGAGFRDDLEPSNDSEQCEC